MITEVGTAVAAVVAVGIFVWLGRASVATQPPATSQPGPSQPGSSARPRAKKAGPAAKLLGNARTVVVIPGHGLGVAQAQAELRDLTDRLVARGATVRFAVHPLAGRMPGHMNLLLDEAGVPHESVLGPDAANAALADADVALVVGADDVVNPAGRATTGTGLDGMKPLDADKARAVVLLSSGQRGFAGQPNALFEAPGTTLVSGDARESLRALAATL